MPTVHYASTKDTDMFYLVGAHVNDPFFYIEAGGEKRVFLNNLEIDAFNQHNTNDALKAVPVGPFLEEARKMSGDTTVSNKLALLLFRKHDLVGTPVAVSNHFPLAMADYVRANGATLTTKDPFVPARERKSAREVEHIRESIRRTGVAFECIEHILRESVLKGDFLEYQGETLTSEYMKDRVGKVLFEQGMENSDGLIISCGAHAAMPHHAGEGPLRPHQTIVCDIFPRSRTTGYFADMTRTYVKGTSSEQVLKMYDAVKRAQDEAIKAIKPGALAKDVHAVSVRVIHEAGFDTGEKGYTHGLGHGLGLDVHELPRLNAHSTAILEVGNVITVEPGLYYGEWGGVRLEDVVVVTEGGCENLTNYPRTLGIG